MKYLWKESWERNMTKKEEKRKRGKEEKKGGWIKRKRECNRLLKERRTNKKEKAWIVGWMEKNKLGWKEICTSWKKKMGLKCFKKFRKWFASWNIKIRSITWHEDCQMTT